jgi:hypothetical protein
MIVGSRHFGNGWPGTGVTRGRGPASCPAGGRGLPRCPSPRSGRTRRAGPPSRPPNSPGWSSARLALACLVAGAAPPPAGPSPLTLAAALRGQARRRGLRHDWPSSSAEAVCLAGYQTAPPEARSAPARSTWRARRHGPGPRRRMPEPPVRWRPVHDPERAGFPLVPPPRADPASSPRSRSWPVQGLAPSWSPRRAAGPEPAGGPDGTCSARSAARLRAAGPVRRRDVLFCGPPPDRRVHDRVPARSPPRTSCRWWSCCTARG